METHHYPRRLTALVLSTTLLLTACTTLLPPSAKKPTPVVIAVTKPAKPKVIKEVVIKDRIIHKTSQRVKNRCKELPPFNAEWNISQVSEWQLIVIRNYKDCYHAVNSN